MMSEDQFLYVEKYRPQTIDECILPVEYKERFKSMVKEGGIQHLLLAGGPGMGKTTVARALCNELNADVLFINASENGNIDVLRVDIRNFASEKSLTGRPKIVILDEADYLSGRLTQPALRGFMEEFAKNCRFIFTANHLNRIIEPLRSRCNVIEFAFTNEEKKELNKQFLKRVAEILKTEGVKFDPHVLVELIKKYAPDFRRILNEIQGNIVDGELSSTILSTFGDNEYRVVAKLVANREFTKLREWVALNRDLNAQELIDGLYYNLDDYVQDNSKPLAIKIIGDAQEKIPFVANIEIWMMKLLTDLMAECDFVEM